MLCVSVKTVYRRLEENGMAVRNTYASITDEELARGGVLPGILGGGVPPGSSNRDPISDLNMPFSTPVFRPDL